MTRILRHFSLAYVTLALGTVVSLVTWYLTGQLVERQTRADFETQAQAAINVIERRTQRYVDLLHGLEGLFGHDLSVSRAEFNRYITSLNLRQRFPGVRAMEFIKRVKDSEKSVYENTVRTDRSIAQNGYPDFGIKPEGTRPEYYVIHYIEPMRGNEPAFGADIRSRDAPLAASERARDAGEPIATGVYRLIQDKYEHSGMVIYLPVYETLREKRTIEQRRSELAGFVNVVFLTKDLFVDVVDAGQHGDPMIHVHDIGPTGADIAPPSRENLLYSSVKADSAQTIATADIESTRQLTIAGRQWLIRFGRFDSHVYPFLQPLSLFVFVTGLVIKHSVLNNAA